MSSLLERYTYGQSEWVLPYGDVKTRMLDEMLTDGPERQNQMINLARRQLEAQRVASQEIAASQIEGARIVAAEVAHSADVISQSIDDASREIGRGIATATEQINGSIQSLETVLCVELSEIKWQLVQQSGQLENILNVLRNSRKNEAQQLLQQGLRHYINGEYAEAEERFQLALGYDSTDYQVLMNLGYISIHKDDTDGAHKFFKKALTLPESLDANSQSRPLWAMSKLFHAQDDLVNAHTWATKAHEKSESPEQLFIASCYLALIGRFDDAWKGLEQAVEHDVRLFARAAIEPLLESVRDHVLLFLAKLAKRRIEELSWEFKTIDGIISSYNYRSDSARIASNNIKIQSGSIMKGINDMPYTETVKILNYFKSTVKVLQARVNDIDLFFNSFTAIPIIKERLYDSVGYCCEREFESVDKKIKDAERKVDLLTLFDTNQPLGEAAVGIKALMNSVISKSKKNFSVIIEEKFNIRLQGCKTESKKHKNIYDTLKNIGAALFGLNVLLYFYPQDYSFFTNVFRFCIWSAIVVSGVAMLVTILEDSKMKYGSFIFGGCVVILIDSYLFNYFIGRYTIIFDHFVVVRYFITAMITSVIIYFLSHSKLKMSGFAFKESQINNEKYEIIGKFNKLITDMEEFLKL